MAILTPTKDTGASTKTLPTVYAEPGQQVTDDQLRQTLPDIGMNTPFIADYLSAMLTHERCGRHLYRAVEGRTNNPTLREKYGSFGEQTERHVTVLEELIAGLGGNPDYVSPSARAVEAVGTKLVETTFMLDGSLDPMTAEMAMLDAVFLAESADHANWKILAELVDGMPEGATRDAFGRAVEEVEAQEDEHVGWASDMKLRMVKLQAASTTMAQAGAKVEEIVVRIKEWFRE